MSIIYDALQKTQKNREYLRSYERIVPAKIPYRPLKFIAFAVAAFILSAASGALVAIYLRATPQREVSANTTKPAVSSSQLAEQKAPIPVAAKTELPPPSTVLPQVSVSAVSTMPETVLPRAEEKAVAAVSEKTSPQESLPVAVAVSPTPMLSTRWTLNGVLISGTEKIALINNQPYHLGDIIEGMKIIAIELNTVRLQNGQEVLELHV